MNIEGIFNLNSIQNKSNSNLNNYTGPSFSESIRDIARSANMQITNGSMTSNLQLSRQKEKIDELFNFTKAEEELVEDYVSRIHKLLNQLHE